jgi:hypothetical protein
MPTLRAADTHAGRPPMYAPARRWATVASRLRASCVVTEWGRVTTPSPHLRYSLVSNETFMGHPFVRSSVLVRSMPLVRWVSISSTVNTRPAAHGD